MWRALLFGFFIVGTLSTAAVADDSTAERNKSYVRRLVTEPPEARRSLMREIGQQATPERKHPPLVSSDRTDLLPVLAAALENDDEQVRESAILTLSYMKCRDALPILDRSLESRYPTVRYYACMGLHWLGEEPDLRERVIAGLQSAQARRGEAFDIRLQASASLDDLGVKQDSAIFVEALRDPRANAAQAAKVLARMRRKETLELMITRLKTATPSTDHWLHMALKDLTGVDFGTDADTWQRWLEINRLALPEQIK